MKKLAQKMLAVALLATSSALMAAPLATLDQIQGDVVIERNGSMIPATAGIQLQQGDSIRALDNGTAVVKFNNCEVPMTSNTFFSVDKAQQCAAAVQTVGVGGPRFQGSVAALSVAAVVVIAAIVNNNQDDDNTPVSP